MALFPAKQAAIGSAKTRSLEKAEERRRTLEFEAEERRRALVEGFTARRAVRNEPITVADAIERFLNSKRKENLREATLAKLETIFKKLKWNIRRESQGREESTRTGGFSWRRL